MKKDEFFNEEYKIDFDLHDSIREIYREIFDMKDNDIGDISDISDIAFVNNKNISYLDIKKFKENKNFYDFYDNQNIIKYALLDFKSIDIAYKKINSVINII